jgi:hypothetical protein
MRLYKRGGRGGSVVPILSFSIFSSSLPRTLFFSLFSAPHTHFSPVMFFPSNIVIASVAALGLQATTVSAHRSCKTKATITAHYDDLNFLPALPLINGIDTYKGLKYNAFAGVQELAIAQTGVLPHSGENQIVTGLPQTLTQGTAYIEATGNTKYFDFKSFYFGCSLDTVESALGVATPCTVTIKGFYEGKLHATQEFDFTPDSLLISEQKKGKLSPAECHTQFQGVDKVEFSSDNPALQVILLDDIKYIPHSCKGK